VDDAFRDFANEVGKAASPYLEHSLSAYLPVEVFDYLARLRAIEPAFTHNLLDSLSTVIGAAADEVSPQTVLALLPRLGGEVHESLLVEFAARYVDHRTLDVGADEQDAMEWLRQLVQASKR
jgi:hypothetical protein